MILFLWRIQTDTIADNFCCFCFISEIPINQILNLLNCSSFLSFSSFLLLLLLLLLFCFSGILQLCLLTLYWIFYLSQHIFNFKSFSCSLYIHFKDVVSSLVFQRMLVIWSFLLFSALSLFFWAPFLFSFCPHFFMSQAFLTKSASSY